MELEFKQMVLIYVILIFVIFLWKPRLFDLKEERTKRKKFLMLMALFIILAVITYYLKIYAELYF
jgi:Ca2+/Na+ antiporter